MNQLDDEIRDRILTSLRDAANDLDLMTRAENEEVMSRSLLRNISLTTVKGQFHRMTKGGARVTPYNFEYTAPLTADQPPLSLKFRVKPESNPPTNIHVLIGRNGVGKTRLLNFMTRVLLKRDQSEDVGIFNKIESDSIWASSSEVDNSLPFSNLVTVTFSAFDPFEPYATQETELSSIQYAYIGLKRTNAQQAEHSTGPKNINELAKEFANSVYECRYVSRPV